MKKQSPKPKKEARPQKPVPIITIHNNNFFSWLLSGFIVCACMFVLGVLVGRNTAPVQFDVDKIEAKLSDLKISILKEKKQTQKTIIKTVDPEPLMEEHQNIIDTLKDARQQPELYKQYVPPVLTPKYAKTPPNKKKPTPEPEKNIAVSGPAKKTGPVVIKKTVDRVEEKTKKSPKHHIQDSGFVIQVASLKNFGKAEILMKKFKEKGYPAFCQPSKLNGEMWHRVRIGPYPDRALAEKDRLRLNEAGVDSLIWPVN